MSIWTDRAWRLPLAAMALLLSLPTAQAQTWTATASGNWSNPANWSSNPAIPASSNTTALVFPSFVAATYTATNDTAITPFILNSMTLNNESNGTLTITNGAGNSLQFVIRQFDGDVAQVVDFDFSGLIVH